MADANDLPEQPEDALTSEEINGTATTASSNKPKNAFTELMSSVHRQGKEASPTSPKKQRDPGQLLNLTHGRGALRAYTLNPASFPSPGRVLWYTDRFVAIHDVFPKSSIHLLLLPRDEGKMLMHPFDAFQDEAFRQETLVHVRKLRRLVAEELRRRWGRGSKSEDARNKALETGTDEDVLPEGRDWESGVLDGVHAHPSMSHLHVHILSPDRCSETMRHRKHYNSFATPFLVPVQDLPLQQHDPRLHPGRAGYLDRDLQCWRCGKGFGNKFTALKKHLADEFEEWKKE